MFLNTIDSKHADNTSSTRNSVPFTDRTKAKLESIVLRSTRRKNGSQNRSRRATSSRPPVLAVSELDPKGLLSVKSIIKNCGDEAAKYFCFVIFSKSLRAENSVERLLALVLLQELVAKSHYVRNHVFEDFNTLVKQIVVIPDVTTLPPPENASQVLHSGSLKLIREWDSKYSSFYGKIKIAIRYLEAQLPEFNNTSHRVVSRREQEENQRRERTQKILRVQLDNLNRELRVNRGVDENVSPMMIIEASASEAMEFMEMLVPSFPERSVKKRKSNPFGEEKLETDLSGEESDDSILWDDESNSATEDTLEQRKDPVAHIPANYELIINIPMGSSSTSNLPSLSKAKSLTRNSEELIRNSLRDCLKEISRSHLVRLNDWISILTRVEPDTVERRQIRSSLLPSILKLKSKLRGIIQTCKEIGIVVSGEEVHTLSMSNYSQMVAQSGEQSIISLEQKQKKLKKPKKSKSKKRGHRASETNTETKPKKIKTSKRRKLKDPFGRK
mmetsp:Transcript_15454/g.18739  ORF Transcript_15454/g.18739 Transcript_15454/m.18739 type:complete len:501 (-) Transcript_15454:104-1606(-)